MEEQIIVNNYIIHFLEKEAKSTKAEIDFSEDVLSSDEFSTTLLAKVHKAVNLNPTLKNTTFKQGVTNNFTNTLTDYLASEDKEDFKKFSKGLTELKEKIQKESFATGGYYLFADYLIDGKRFITVVLLRKKSELNITKISGTYKLNSAENINIDKLAMAFRLNYQIYSATGDSRNYVALITTQNKEEVSGYFRDWVSSGEYIKSDKNTQNLVKIIKAIELPKDEDGKDIYSSTNDFIKAVHDYAKPRANRFLSLRDMGKHFYNDENVFMAYATSKNIIIDAEFKRDPGIWRNLVTIRAKVEGVELNVDYNKINKVDVVVEENRIIINSKKLIDQINKQYGEAQKET